MAEVTDYEIFRDLPVGTDPRTIIPEIREELMQQFPELADREFKVIPKRGRRRDGDVRHYYLLQGAGPEGGGGGEAHPLLGSGFDWISAENSPLYDDLAWTTPIAGETEDRVNSIGPAEDGLRHWVINGGSAVTELFFAAGDDARAINGKPVLYASSNRLTVLRNAANDANEQIQTWIEDENYSMVVVARRHESNGGNDRILAQWGSNTPGAVVLSGANTAVFRNFNDALNNRFITVPWTNGAVAVMALRWNDSTTMFEISMNGGEWVTQAGTSVWTPAGKTGSIGLAPSDISDLACSGVFAGVKTREELEELSAALMTYYGIE